MGCYVAFCVFFCRRCLWVNCSGGLGDGEGEGRLRGEACLLRITGKIALRERALGVNRGCRVYGTWYGYMILENKRHCG